MKKLLWLSMLSVLAVANVNAETLMSNGGNPACGIVEGPVFEVPAQTIQCPACPKCDEYQLIPGEFTPERVEVIPATWKQAQMVKVCPTPTRQRCYKRCHSCHAHKAPCASCQRRVHHARENGYEIVDGYERMG